MKNSVLNTSAVADLIADNGTATFKGHSDHPGIAEWIRETETTLAKCFDFPELFWMDKKSIESNIRFRVRLGETEGPEEEKALRAVGKDGLVLKDIPVGLQTPVVCTMAVEDNGLALQYVPPSLKTKKMCIDAAMGNGEAVKFAPEAIFDQEICDMLVSVDRAAFSHIPNRFKTLPMSVKVVSRADFMLKHVPDTLKPAVQKAIADQEIQAAQKVLEGHEVSACQ